MFDFRCLLTHFYLTKKDRGTLSFTHFFHLTPNKCSLYINLQLKGAKLSFTEFYSFSLQEDQMSVNSSFKCNVLSIVIFHSSQFKNDSYDSLYRAYHVFIIFGHMHHINSHSIQVIFFYNASIFLSHFYSKLFHFAFQVINFFRSFYTFLFYKV